MSFYLGIDAGSVSLKLVVWDGDRILWSSYRRVSGALLSNLVNAFNDLKKETHIVEFDGVLVVGSGRHLISEKLGIPNSDEISAQVEAGKFYNKNVRSIIEIGGQDAKAISIKDNGAVDFIMNDLCAAGTGSFLDQQATRLGLKVEDLSDIAMKSKSPLVIASRCAVFAKSDMTHHQQAGKSISDIVAGLHLALAKGFVTHVSRGLELKSPVHFHGGVVANIDLVKRFENVLGTEIFVPENYNVTGALGASIMAKDFCYKTNITYLINKVTSSESSDMKKTKPLSGKIKHVEASWEKIDGVFFGIDVGSVSVKFVAIGNGGPLYYDYQYSNGNPKETLANILANAKIKLNLIPSGVGVTGSGRSFASWIVGGDKVPNEISAQARALRNICNTAESVVEIGGQDAKYLEFENGKMIKFNMNRSCAAGTGAFLTEQCPRLGFKNEQELSDFAMKAKFLPSMGARCAVFMESDIVSYQQAGFEREELAGGLAVSVITNYLEKVANADIKGKKVLFIGGVSENTAVASALSQEINDEVYVSKWGKYSGAIGAALIASDAKVRGEFTKTKFSWEKFANIESDNCKDCGHSCRIWKINDKIFGGRCGKFEQEVKRGKADFIEQRMNLLLATECRDEGSGNRDQKTEIKCHHEQCEGSRVLPAEGWSAFGGKKTRFLAKAQNDNNETQNKKLRSTTHDSLFTAKVGIPKSLLFYDRFPLWKTFFNEIDCEVVLSEGKSVDNLPPMPSDTCLPLKLLVKDCIELDKSGLDIIFVPFSIMDADKNAHCPLVLSAPLFAKFGVRTPVISPMFNWEWDPKTEQKQFTKLATQFGLTEKDGFNAWKKARMAQDNFEKNVHELGQNVLKDKSGNIFVVLGKDYNIFDVRLNSNALSILSDHLPVISQDMLVNSSPKPDKDHSQMLWHHGREMIMASRIIAENERLLPVLITSFACGPDSFTIKYIKNILKDKPLLILEVDEHTSEVGIATRVEAYLDTISHSCRCELVCNSEKGSKDICLSFDKPDSSALPQNDKRHTIKINNWKRILIPNFSLHSYGFLSAVKMTGLEAKLLPLSDDKSYAEARRYIDGNECHPYVLLLGDMLKASKDAKEGDCFFMPKSISCRAGHFGKHMGLIADKIDSPIQVSDNIEGLARIGGKSSTFTYPKMMISAWMFMRCADLFYQKYYETRVRALDKNEVENVFKKGVKLIDKTANENKNVIKAFKEISGMFDEVSIEDERKIKIGITGDYFTRISDFANNNVLNEISNRGFDLLLSSTFADLVLFDVKTHIPVGLRHRDLKKIVAGLFLKAYVPKLERRIQNAIPCRYNLSLDYDRAERELKGSIPMPVHSALSATMANIVEQVRAGAKGIVNIITFNCTYGAIISAYLRKLSIEKGIPSLTLIYEGQKPTHNLTRLEAFLNQMRKGSK